ncbi:MAG: hypothetical protein IIA20_01395 [Thaumarchaeota archaeon]|nr:hypothetical protein [Nitrososphaerota archaeon]
MGKRNNSIIISSVLVAFVVGSIMMVSMAYAVGDKNGQPFEALWDAIHDIETAISEIETGSDGHGGEVFVRWGSPLATSETSLLHSGIVMGTNSEHFGSGNTLCVATDAENSGFVSSTGDLIYAGLTQTGVTPFSSEIPDSKIIQCAVLFSVTPILQIWGKTTGPTGWSNVYSGYSMSTHLAFHGGNDRICIDAENFDDSISGTIATSGNLFYPTTIKFSSGVLEEVHNTIMSCAVFAKNP